MGVADRNRAYTELLDLICRNRAQPTATNSTSPATPTQLKARHLACRQSRTTNGIRMATQTWWATVVMVHTHAWLRQLVGAELVERCLTTNEVEALFSLLRQKQTGDSESAFRHVLGRCLVHLDRVMREDSVVSSYTNCRLRRLCMTQERWLGTTTEQPAAEKQKKKRRHRASTAVTTPLAATSSTNQHWKSLRRLYFLR